ERIVAEVRGPGRQRDFDQRAVLTVVMGGRRLAQADQALVLEADQRVLVTAPHAVGDAKLERGREVEALNGESHENLHPARGRPAPRPPAAPLRSESDRWRAGPRCAPRSPPRAALRPPGAPPC